MNVAGLIESLKGVKGTDQLAAMVGDVVGEPSHIVIDVHAGGVLIVCKPMKEEPPKESPCRES